MSPEVEICHHTSSNDWAAAMSNSFSSWEGLMVKDHNETRDECDRWGKEQQATFWRDEEGETSGIVDLNNAPKFARRSGKPMRIETSELPRILEDQPYFVSSPLNERSNHNSPINTTSPESTILTKTSIPGSRYKRTLSNIMNHIPFTSKSHSSGSTTLVDAEERKEQTRPHEGYRSYESYLRVTHNISNWGSPNDSLSSSQTLVNPSPALTLESAHELERGCKHELKSPKTKFILPTLLRKRQLRPSSSESHPDLYADISSADHPDLRVRLQNVSEQLTRTKAHKEAEERGEIDRKIVRKIDEVYGGQREEKTGLRLHPQMYYHWREARAESVPWWVLEGPPADGYSVPLKKDTL